VVFGKDANQRFLKSVDDLLQIAESMGSILCIFTYKSNIGWNEFDKSVADIESRFLELDRAYNLSPDINVVLRGRSRVVQMAAAGLSVGNINCSDVRGTLATQLPGGGGGNGGGGGKL
jgi:hypothetical protein